MGIFNLPNLPFPALLSQLLLGLVNGSFYAILSLGLAVIFGLLNVINFAHGALFMMGAVLTWMGLNYFNISYWAMLVLAPVIPDGSDIARTLAQRGLPIVLFDRRSRGLEDLPLVALDHEAAGRLATQHLIDLGHERIAVATQVPSRIARLLDPAEPVLRPSARRLRGYLTALREAGIPLDSGLIIDAPYDHLAAADAVAAKLPGLEATALFATDSVVTHGAFQALQRLGVQVPGELSFLGFDDQHWTTLVNPQITVLTQPLRGLGQAAADLLSRRIAHPSETAEDVILRGELLIRQSSREL